MVKDIDEYSFNILDIDEQKDSSNSKYGERFLKNKFENQKREINSYLST